MQISKHILKSLSKKLNSTRTSEPTREYVNNIPGGVMLEFGSVSCGYCQSAQEIISDEMESFLNVDHIKIEDGRGKKLGRSFEVQNWPTLIFMKDGKELKRLVRHINLEEFRACLESISTRDLDYLKER